MICPTRSRNHMFASHFGESHESASKKFYAPTIFPLSHDNSAPGTRSVAGVMITLRLERETISDRKPPKKGDVILLEVKDENGPTVHRTYLEDLPISFDKPYAGAESSERYAVRAVGIL